MTHKELREYALSTYREARKTQDTCSAAQTVWMALRKLPQFSRLRAPDAFEKLFRNGSKRRSYISPLGSMLNIPLANSEYGSHCARYKRTVKSCVARLCTAEIICDFFERRLNSDTAQYIDELEESVSAAFKEACGGGDLKKIRGHLVLDFYK